MNNWNMPQHDSHYSIKFLNSTWAKSSMDSQRKSTIGELLFLLNYLTNALDAGNEVYKDLYFCFPSKKNSEGIYSNQ